MGFNEDIIAEFRAHNGMVSTMGFGGNLVIVHSLGARSGRELDSPLLGLPTESGGVLIVGSGGGSPKTPAWVYNLRATPEVSIERRVDGSVVTQRVLARELSDDEWDPAWRRFTDKSRSFADYTKTAQGRRFPIFELIPA